MVLACGRACLCTCVSCETPASLKESELQRREALKKKLESDAQKNKKKKKKLI